MRKEPEIEVGSRSGVADGLLAWLEGRCRVALGEVLDSPGADAVAILRDMDALEICLVDDGEIAAVHRKFMGIDGATDVITFQHGEIVISVDTARRAAGELGVPVERELLLYAIHGMLHLAGYDDTTPEARARMHACQERVLDQVWAGLSGGSGS